MMFLLAPLLIGMIVYYTAVDILAYRKKRGQRSSPPQPAAQGTMIWGIWEEDRHPPQRSTKGR